VLVGFCTSSLGLSPSLFAGKRKRFENTVLRNLDWKCCVSAITANLLTGAAGWLFYQLTWVITLALHGEAKKI
jgi:hypothetical protein